MKKTLCLAAALALFAAAIIFTARFTAEKTAQRKSDALLAGLQAQANGPAAAAKPKPEPEPQGVQAGTTEPDGNAADLPLPPGGSIPEKDIDFGTLQSEVNKDIYAWVYVPNTRIDYPVAQHGSDDAHYLDYNLDGTKGLPGAIYTEKLNAKDFTDPLTVMYGHNMKNGTMFTDLHKFEDLAFFEENPCFFVYTKEAAYAYRIYAAHKYSNLHLLNSVDTKDPRALQTFINYTLSLDGTSANIRDGLQMDETDKDRKILTLSTCTGNSGTRYLVSGVLIKTIKN